MNSNDNSNPTESNFSEERYAYHHAKWVAEYRSGNKQRARRHLYALRAHLHTLGWLTPALDHPGYGVRTKILNK